MNVPFLSTRLPRGTFVFLTERKRSSIRGQERLGLSTSPRNGNEKEQMTWVVS